MQSLGHLTINSSGNNILVYYVIVVIFKLTKRNTFQIVAHVVWTTFGSWRSETRIRYVQTQVHESVLAGDDVLLVGQERPGHHGNVLEAKLQPLLLVLAV